jgi:hypothetical protein
MNTSDNKGDSMPVQLSELTGKRNAMTLLRPRGLPPAKPFPKPITTPPKPDNPPRKPNRSALSDKFHQFLNDAPPLVLTAKIVSADVSAKLHTSDLSGTPFASKTVLEKLHLDILQEHP